METVLLHLKAAVFDRGIKCVVSELRVCAWAEVEKVKEKSYRLMEL